MANFIVAYKGDTLPASEKVDAHLTIQAANCGQLLPNVWWVDYHGSAAALRNWVQKILAPQDLLVVVEAKNAAWSEILVDGDVLAHAWDQAA